MRSAVAPRSVRLERPALDESLVAMRDAALESANGAAADELVVEVARKVDGNDTRAMLAGLAGALRSRVVYVGDGFGGDDVQNLEATLERGAGDCDDFAVAYAALAMRAGYRAGFAVLFDQGGTTGEHVLPIVEVDGEPFPVELTRTIPAGSWPADRARFGWYYLASAWGALGFLDAIVGAIGNAITGNQQAKAAKKVAEATKEAAATTAGASTVVATIAERTAAEERASRERIVASSLEFGRSALPMLGRMVAIVAGASVVRALLERKGTSRARPRRAAA